MTDDHPELAGYEPVDRPRRPGRQRAMRIAVVLALAAMVLPIVLSTFSVATSTARSTCAAFATAAAGSTGGDLSTDAPFELFAAGGPGWQCYVTTENGSRHHLANFGLFPAAPRYGVGTPT
ncbi:hypothetical protein [Agromyces sp. Leaf222]|uniref:hypothetical protein n=1 Tax=Agromyces sp. Leaf222 TaxID=1735688 RepID=UPI0006F2CFEF|nr:hypothetical protein [Agromyces sp. Leaf222]KQM82977.1 hypothetical protein ASE68_06690 [Agromyces sp. Leaf222]